MPGQRRALELAGVRCEQLRVLSSQPGPRRRAVRCVLSSHAWASLLRMQVLRDPGTGTCIGSASALTCG